MNRDLENWEEIISSKFDGQQIPFNESDWDSVEERIEKIETSAKRKRWFTIYSLGIVSGALLVLIAAKFLFSADSKSNQLAANSQAKTSIQKENTVSVVVTNANKETAQDQSAKQNGNADQHVSAQTITATSQTSKREELLTEKISQLMAENDQLHSELNNQKQLNQSLPVNANSQPVVSQDPIKAPDVLTGNQANEVAVTSAQNLNAGKLIDSNVKPVTASMGKRTGEKSSSLLVVSDSTKSVDTIPLTFGKPNPVLDPLMPQVDTTHSRNTFYVETGANMMLGWNYNNIIDGRGMNLVAGFAFAHFFNPKWSMSTGVRFESVGHLHESQKQVVDSLPNFGLNNRSTLITPQTLYYLSVPLKIERTFNGRNSLGVGTSFSYLFNTTSHVETINVTDGYQMLIGDPKTQHGYFGGLNRFDIAFNLSYRRQLFPKWYLTLEGTYGLMDVKNNSYFTNSHNQAEHLLGGRFLLTYKLF